MPTSYDPDLEVDFSILFGEEQSEFVPIQREQCDIVDSLCKTSEERMDFVPTPQEFEQGLSDSNPDVRAMFAIHHIAGHSVTPDQVEHGLTDSDAIVRCAFVRRRDYI